MESRAWSLVMAIFSPQLESSVKRLTKLALAGSSYACAMDDIYAIRRRNLNEVLKMPAMAKRAREQDKALLVGVSASMFSQAKNPEYKIGDDFSRKVEAALKLEYGWMDNDHSGMPTQSQSAGLDAERLASSITLSRLAHDLLDMEFDPAIDADTVAQAYSWLLARDQRSATLDNVVEFSKFMKRHVQRAVDDGEGPGGVRKVGEAVS